MHFIIQLKIKTKMKNLKNILFAAILISAPFTFIKAQKDYADASKKPVLFTSASQVRELYNAIAMENKSGVRAMKDLATRFKNGSDVKWFAGDNLISATVIKDGIKSSVLYTKNGRWFRTTKSYNESSMPADIRELVKRSEYFDSNILYVWEVQERDVLYYVVHLQNENTVNEIVVYNGEITLLKKYLTQ